MMSRFFTERAGAASRGFPARLLCSKLKPLALALCALGSGLSTGSLWASPATDAADSEIQFNLDRLNKVGIDPKVAALFSRKPRFTQGTRRVTLWVNGMPRGAVDARFDAEGQLCFTEALLDQGNLKLPVAQSPAVDDLACLDFIGTFPQTEIELRPGREEVALVVSVDALRPLNEDIGAFQRGGTAGVLNYELMGSQNQFSGTSSRYASANTEVGFNAGDWLLRSRQMFTERDGARSFQALYTYAQKTFVQHKVMLQVGEINIDNSVFPGTAITGLQVLPDNALQGRARSGATVEGIAQSQARVEVRQSGALIHTSLVPAGPFRLPGIQLVNGNTDLDVRVIEANGEQRDFTVAAASLAQFSHTAPGYSVAAGQVRSFGAAGMQSPTVVTATGGWLLSPQHKVSAGLLASQNQYQAAAFTLDSALTAKTSLNLRGTLANAGEEGQQGAEASVRFSTRVTDKLSASADLTLRSESFRDLLDTTRDHESRYRHGGNQQQYGGSLNWNDALLGSFSAGYATATSFAGHHTQHLTGAWNKSFQNFSVSANLERSMNRSARQRHHDHDHDHDHDSDYVSRHHATHRSSYDDAVYLSISVPLGSSRSLRTYANQRDGRTRFGGAYSDSSHELASYQLSADSNTEDRQRDFSGNVNLMPRYARLNLGYAQSGQDSTSYNGQLSGGLVLHEDGLTLSPYPLRDTFAVAKVGDVAGVKLSTPSGPVWTDPWGRAVVSQLHAYQPSQVEIATKTLPRNVDIKNGFKAVTAGRGSVNKLDFAVVTTRRVLLRARDVQGQILNKGAGVFNAEEQFLTTVVDSGKIFLSNDQLSERLLVRLDDGQRCQLDFTLPDKADPNVYFESADAICRPL